MHSLPSHMADHEALVAPPAAAPPLVAALRARQTGGSVVATGGPNAPLPGPGRPPSPPTEAGVGARPDRQLSASTSGRAEGGGPSAPTAALHSWAEAAALAAPALAGRAVYVPLSDPPPRSTIAASFSPDGQLLASTHGDHTVKVVRVGWWEQQRGEGEGGEGDRLNHPPPPSPLLRVLAGHLRTPWAVRFHPASPGILASGSLDHEVRVWDCEAVPKAAPGGLPAGGPPAGASTAAAAAAPLTTTATVARHAFGRPVASLAWAPGGQALAIAAGHRLYWWGVGGAVAGAVAARAAAAAAATGGGAARGRGRGAASRARAASPASPLDGGADGGDWWWGGRGPAATPPRAPPLPPPPPPPPPVALLRARRSLRAVQFHPGGAPILLTAEVSDWPASVTPTAAAAVASAAAALAGVGGRGGGGAAPPAAWGAAVPAAWPPSAAAGAGARPPGAPPPPASLPLPPGAGGGGRAGASAPPLPPADAAAAAAVAAASAAAAAAAAGIIGAEAPCHVRIRLWRADWAGAGWEGPGGEAACEAAAAARAAPPPPPPLPPSPLLTIPGAVLCSEMGAHFSPDGHRLAACVAATTEGGGASGAPPPYELRLYSTAPGPAWGTVLSARPLPAPQCLTSIQFSPTGEHVLVAYGRRHPALLVVGGGGGGSGGGGAPPPPPRFTVLEVFASPSLRPVSSLASGADEVNAALFCPVPGGGLAYGTKEGRLRLVGGGGRGCGGGDEEEMIE